MKVAYADCFSGISGDMFLAALLDAGLPLDTLRKGIDALGLPEKVELRLTKTHKGGLRAASLEVIVPDSQQSRESRASRDDRQAREAPDSQDRSLADILAIVSAARLSDRVKGAAGRIFTLLAEAEARVHGEPVEQVHFHEVGALDSIVDVVGAAIGLDALGIERLYASPLPYGSGAVESRHGLLPLPAPATLELLRRARAPLTPTPAQEELVTPTGAAILAALATFDRPDLTIASIGVGAGKRDLPWPNLMRLIVGEAPAIGETPAVGETPATGQATATGEAPGVGEAPATGETSAERAAQMVQLETNIDDMNPQFYGHVMDKLFAAGARDVFLTPIQMKKNRPATLLGVIALRRDEAALAELILRETTTLGLRVQPIGRYEAAREVRQIETAYGPLGVKVKILDGKVLQAVPEYDDCVRLANEKGVSLAEIYKAVYEALAR